MITYEKYKVHNARVVIIISKQLHCFLYLLAAAPQFNVDHVKDLEASFPKKYKQECFFTSFKLSKNQLLYEIFLREFPVKKIAV